MILANNEEGQWSGPVGPGGHPIPYAVEIFGAPRAEVVLCHGLMGNMDEHDCLHLRLSHALAREGFRVHRFDFRGHGSSLVPPAEVTLADMASEFAEVIEIASSASMPIVIVATSFGALPTLVELGKSIPASLAGVIFWNPVLNAKEVFIDPGTPWSATAFESVGDRTLGTSETFTLDQFTFGSEITREMQNWKTYRIASRLSVASFHGTEDVLVPYHGTRKTFVDIFGTDATWIPIDGVGHGFGDAGEEVLRSTVGKAVAMVNVFENE